MRAAWVLASCAAAAAQPEGPALVPERTFRLPVERAAHDLRAVFSRDGRRLFAWCGGAAWVLDLRGGEPRRVDLHGARVLGAVAGADGPEVVVVTTSAVSVVSGGTGATVRAVCRSPYPREAGGLEAARSPDGRRVVLHGAGVAATLVDLRSGATVRLGRTLRAACWGAAELVSVTGSGRACEDPADPAFAPTELQRWSLGGALGGSRAYRILASGPPVAATALALLEGGDVLVGSDEGLVVLGPRREVRAVAPAMLWARVLRRDRVLVQEVGAGVRLTVFSFPDWRRLTTPGGVDQWAPDVSVDLRRVVWREGRSLRVAKVRL